MCLKSARSGKYFDDRHYWQSIFFRQAKNLLLSNRSKSYFKPRVSIELPASRAIRSLPPSSVPLQVEGKGAGFLLFCQSCLFLHSYYWNIIFDCKDCRERSGFEMQSPKNSLVLKFSSVSHRFNCLPELSKFKRKWFSMELNV